MEQIMIKFGLRPLILLVNFFFVSSYLYSQNHTVHIVVNKSVIDEIEHQLIKDVFELLNRRSDSEITYSWYKHKQFKSMIAYLDSIKADERDSHLAISSITITPERLKKYDFSNPYVPVRDVLISLKSRKVKLGTNNFSNSKIGYNVGTVQENSIRFLKRKFEFQEAPFKTQKDKNMALIRNDIDFYIGDNINVWSDKRFKIIMELEEQNGNGYGILLIKNSSLKKIIDPVLSYYLRSAKFRKMTTEKFGADISEYFMKMLFKN